MSAGGQVSENFSETRKGGRPRLIASRELRRVIDFATGNPNATKRTRQNKFYQLRAMRTLGLEVDENTPARYYWIWDKPNVPRDGDHRVKWTVLAELGRVEGDNNMRALAAYVCKERLTTRAAVLAIRRLRAGEPPPADALELANAMIATINDYGSRRSGLSADDIRDALRTVEANIVEEVK